MYFNGRNEIQEIQTYRYVLTYVDQHCSKFALNNSYYFYSVSYNVRSNRHSRILRGFDLKPVLVVAHGEQLVAPCVLDLVRFRAQLHEAVARRSHRQLVG